MSKTCENCKYWESFERTDNQGECRLNPPNVDLQTVAMVISDLSQGREYDGDDDIMFYRSAFWWSFPITENTSWCGQGEAQTHVDF